jgi:hypothetical protein
MSVSKIDWTHSLASQAECFRVAIVFGALVVPTVSGGDIVAMQEMAAA